MRQAREFFSLKVVLYNIDVTAMCSVVKCKQSCFIDHLLHSKLWSIAMHSGGQCAIKHLGRQNDSYFLIKI